MSPLKVLISLCLLAVIGTAGLVAVRLALFAYRPAEPGSNREYFMLLQKGDRPSGITQKLADQKMITDAHTFQWLGRLTREWGHVKAGEYRITPGMTPAEIFATITSGISVAHPVTVREGENMYEIGDDLQAKGLATKAAFLKLCRDPKFLASAGLKDPAARTAEGFLFPDTYFLNRTMSTEDMVRQMIKRFNAAWIPEFEKQAEALKLTRYQAVTLASIVEKETGAPQERAIISSVFHNRLRIHMRLQSDPTTIYGMWERYDGNIHKSDLLAENAYNTYTVPALPAGPISNPGIEAIHAALNPATTDYLFFVSHNDGTHQFSKSLADHNLAVQKFQLDPKAREGKSWRDLSKKR